MIANRNASLDGLRGVAILAVMCSHFTGPFQADDPLERVAAKILSAGWIGVDLFFALSGFLITRRLLDSRGSGATRLVTFWRNRALRIFPIYYLFLIACTGLGAFPNVSYWLYYCNFTGAFADSEIYSVRSHLWSLAVEEQFYLLWPFAVIWLRPSHLVRWAVGLCVLALALRAYGSWQGWPTQFLYRATFFRVDALCCGALAALLDRRTMQRWGILGLAIVIAAAVFARGLPYDQQLVQLVGFSGLGLTFSWLVSAADGGAAHRFLARPWLVACGKYSYAAYLLHWPLAMLLWMRLVKAHLSLPATLLLACAEIACVFLASALVYALVEKHFLRLKADGSYTAQSAPVPVTTR